MVRQGTEQDIEYIEAELSKFADYENNRDFIKMPERQYIAECIREYMKDGIFLVHDRGGFLLARKFFPQASPDKCVLSSMFIWTNEDQRRTGIGFELLEAMVEIGKATDHVTHIALNLESTSAISDNMLKRLGFPTMPYEISYLREA